MSTSITDDLELKNEKSKVRMAYVYVKMLRDAPGNKTQEQVNADVESVMREIKETKAAIKVYEANRPRPQFMEVKHRHLVSEADRMVMKFSHLLEESLNRKVMKVEAMAKAIPGAPYAPVTDPQKRALLDEARVLKMVVHSIIQARDQFTADAVEYHRKMLEERLALGARPAQKKRKS